MVVGSPTDIIRVCEQELDQLENTKYGNIKTMLPQIGATFAVSLLHIPLVGMAMGYSAAFIAQMDECKNSTKNCTDAILLTETQNSWIASILAIFIPVGAIICSAIMDSVGRLNVMMLSIIPGVAGWTLIAVANSFSLILLGRVFTGISAAWGLCASLVYISEISSPNIRGSMCSVATVTGSFGIALSYVLGYFFYWRAVAWICVAITILVGILIKYMPKSPVWLVSKGRIDEAEASLNWIYKYHRNPVNESRMQLELLSKVHGKQQKGRVSNDKDGIKSKLRMFLEPTVYRPIIILSFLNVFTQFSGVYITVFYAVSLFQAAGTSINPYIAAIYFGSARVMSAILAVGLTQYYGRRPMMVTSGLLMTVSMVVSGLYTKWIQEGSTTNVWVPVVMMILYIFATILGFITIPPTIPAELFPTPVRGMAQSISLAVLYVLAFASIRSYYVLLELLGGASGVQFFFAAISFGGVLYSYVFLPETHNKELHEIGYYFEKHSVYLWYMIRRKANVESMDSRL